MGPQRIFGMTPWVRRLFVANLVVFLFQMTIFVAPRFLATFGFVPLRALAQPWTFVTYMFLHGGPLHLAFNLLALFVFGPDVEEQMGGGPFLAYYLLCGLGGAALSFALMQFRPVELVIGASAAVYGVLLAFAWVAPDRPIYVFPLPEPIPAKWLVTFTVAVSLGLAIFPPIDKVSHLVHLGGFGAGCAARLAAERAGPPGPRGPGERRGTQAAPPAARRGTGGDRPRTRQDLGTRNREPHARRAEIPRGDEPKDAGQGLRATCSRCSSSCPCRIPQAAIPTPCSPRGCSPRRAAPPSGWSPNSPGTRMLTSRWGGCGTRGPPRAATARSTSSARRSGSRRASRRRSGGRSRWGIGWGATRARASPGARCSGCLSSARGTALPGRAFSSCTTTTPSGAAPTGCSPFTRT